MQDRSAQTTLAKSIAQGAHTATVNGTGVDTSNYDAATVYFIVETITDGTHTPKVQDSPDNSVWTDVPAANLIGTFAALASNVNQKVGYVGINKYVRAVSTVSGATTGGVYSAQVVLAIGRKLPQVA